MNPELTRKLLSRTTNGGPVQPTPRQIQDCIEHQPKNFVPPKQLWMQMPPEVVMKFVSNTGRLKEKKIKRFFRSLELFQDDFIPGDLLKLSTDCLHKDGSIIGEKLREILEDIDKKTSR